MFLPQLLGGDAFDVLQVGIGPGRGNHLDADRRAVWDPENDEQKADRRGDVCKLCQVATSFFGDVRRADFPASAVEAGLKSQAPYNFPCVLSGVGIADVDGLPGIAAEDGVDHRADDAFGLALCLKVVSDLLALRDQDEVIAENAGKLRDLIVQKVCLAGMKLPPYGRAVVLIGDAESTNDMQVLVAADERIGSLRHGISPAEVRRSPSPTEDRVPVGE